MREIFIRNACIHNIKNIDLKIPKNKLVVVTGVSGSGKSSIIFDVLFEEGRRMFLQSAGILPMLNDSTFFDYIDGLSPTIAVKQKIIRDSNPRSVVGTKTKILDYLRLMYSTDGIMQCSTCGNKLNRDLLCSNCGRKNRRLEPQYFSFNTMIGMCLKCKGRGYISDISVNSLIRTKDDNLIQICKKLSITSSRITDNLKSFAEYFGFDLNTPYKNIKSEAQNAFLYGIRNHNFRFWGIIPYFRWKIEKGRPVEGLIEKNICPSCSGTRLGEEARNVTINNKNIGQVSLLSMQELSHFLNSYLNSDNCSIKAKHCCNITLKKVNNMIDVGLSHLTLYRGLPSLSGGELQRLFLMSNLEAEMESLIYIFDEPTSGLHEIEKDLLLDKIEKLCKFGNSVIIVEHDKNTIRRAEHIIDFGPKAGVEGGKVIYQGNYDGLLKCASSLTGAYLSDRLKFPKKSPDAFKKIDESTPYIKLYNVSTNNLKNIDVKIPLGMMVGLAGVSGSGKSSLIGGTLIPKLKEHFKNSENKSKIQDESGEEDNEELLVKPQVLHIEGLENIDGYNEINQLPIGRSRKSVIVSYIGIWNKIREIFACQAIAKENFLKAGDFSFNSDGACLNCKGMGYIEENYGDLGIITKKCSECDGKRFKPEILEIKYRNKSITDILDMSVSEGADFFRDYKDIFSMLKNMKEMGMGYISLGQPTSTLSGGEAQRLKLSKGLGKIRSNKNLYILDEPTTGLSFYDIEKLIEILNELVDKGNTVIIIEHDPSVLSYCDWIIELGPNGGPSGGEIITFGPPHDIKNNARSKIGRFL